MNKNIATEKEIFGHPVGLFMLFFTEMWERFSYYGMKALLMLYMTKAITDDNPGLGWGTADASGLYGWYTMLVYFTPVIGGIIADKIFGFRKTILFGAVLMTLGHLSLAFVSADTILMFYLGLTLLILGNGAFKPNISSLVGQLYSEEDSKKKDSGYTIFYQGINVGAFLGTVLCGYFGENYGWHYGFGLAGIFMLIGYIQFKLSQDMFGELGAAPNKDNKKDIESKEKEPLTKIEKDRLIVVGVLAFFSIFFWAAFEQAGASMTIFAEEHTDRSLSGNGIVIFKIVSSIISASPLIVLTWLFIGMYKSIGKIYQTSIMFMMLTVVILWGMIGYMIYDNYMQESPEVPASWFLSFNALFIFTLAPLFSKIWLKLSKTKMNPNGPQKFAIGLILLGIGFIPLVVSSASIEGNSTQKVSMIFLTLAYLIHTMGELSLSPVGLSYVNKLSPKKLLGVLFGIWFLASGLGNKLAGELSSHMETIQQNSSLSDFFLILVLIPIIAGVILFLLSFYLKKLMHGVE